MKPIDFIRLVLKHKVVLTTIPMIFGILAIVLTSNPKRSYYSQTILYTGIASGSSIEMDKSFNYLATNNAFDNLINIIKSRETQEEVAIRLLSQHLLLDGPNPAFISVESYEELMEILPEDIKALKSQFGTDKDSYEALVAQLTSLMAKDNSNFVYAILNFDHPYYSLEAISKVKAERISSSDLVKLSYEIDDPGICQQTLAIYNEVCIKKYKVLKENGSDAVVKYFETQLKESDTKLKAIEQKLLQFNQQNNIINYYEQSKAVAIVKEDMEVEYKKKMAQLAGSEASAKRLEKKLEIQELIQDKNNTIIESKKRLGMLNYKIGMYEAKASVSKEAADNVRKLKREAEDLQREIKSNVDVLYTFQNSVDGVPIQKVLPDWVDKDVETEDLKAKLVVMDEHNKAIEKQFAKYAPAGANLKRIEREIDVAEQEYLEILHGLNLAKLKFQDTQLSSNLRAVDPPYFPLKPIPSKRKFIIAAIILLTGFVILGTILFMEYFDDTLKNDKVAAEKLGLPALGMFSKVFKSSDQLGLLRIQDRLMDFVMQRFHKSLESQGEGTRTKIITVLSTRGKEGKTTVTKNIAKELISSGKSVLVLNHSEFVPLKTKSSKSAWMYRLFGYEDPRIDYSHPFLKSIDSSLKVSEYQLYNLDNSYRSIDNYLDLNFNKSCVDIKDLDYVIIELPNLLESNYSSRLLAKSDLALLVCRSNRLWSKADENVLNTLKEPLGSRLRFIINGVGLKEVESVLGELPKYRTTFRRRVKNVLRFQFYTNQHI